MLILGLETATERIGVALIGSTGILSSYEVTRGRHHAEILVPAIDFVCSHADVAVEEISAIAVDLGPGLFTGMRVGVATAQAMAQALEVPVIGLTSLDVLAYSCRHRGDLVLSIVDARKGQVFYGFHRVGMDEVEVLCEPRVGVAGDVIAAIEDRGQRVLCVGDGALRYRQEFEGHPLIEMADRYLAHPSVQNLVILALRKALREQWSPPGDVRAVYVRPPDAEINWATRPLEIASDADVIP